MMEVIRFSIVFAFLAIVCYVHAETTMIVEEESTVDGKCRVKATPETRRMIQEKECLAAGGICVHSSKCPEDKLNRSVDCVAGKDSGAVCCHSILDPEETNCDNLAGMCRSECPASLRVAQAQNCPQGEVCCTLIA